MELLKNLTALQELRKKPSPVEIPSGPVGGAMDTMETMPMCLEEHFDKRLDVQARLQKNLNISSFSHVFFHVASGFR